MMVITWTTRAYQVSRLKLLPVFFHFKTGVFFLGGVGLGHSKEVMGSFEAFNWLLISTRTPGDCVRVGVD